MKKLLVIGCILLTCGLLFSAEMQSFYKAKFSGLNNKVNIRLLSDDEAYDLSNFNLDEIGSIKERDLFGKYNSSSGSLGSNFITGLFKFYTTSNKYFIACAGNKICKGVSGVWTDITQAGISPIASTYWTAVTFNNEIYLFNETVIPQEWNGATAATVNPAGYPTTNCAYAVVHKNRIWAAKSTTLPYRIYWSSLNNAEDWVTTGGYTDLPDLTQTITGLISWGGYLYIFTETNIYVLLGSTPNDFSLRKTNSMVGAIAPRSIKVTDVGICFLARSGVYAFDGNNASKISDKIDVTIKGISKTLIQNSCAIYDGNKYWLAYSPTSSSYNSEIAIYDILIKDWYLYKGEACNISYFERAYGGTDKGELYGGSSITSGIIYQLQSAIGTESLSYSTYDDFSSQVTFNTVITNIPSVILDGVYGDGRDGSWDISVVKNINIDTNGNNGRTTADGINYAMTSSVLANAVTIPLTNTTGLSAGDYIIIANMQAPASGNQGLVEVKKISGVSTNISITLTEQLVNSYDGTTDKIIVQRIPQYSSITINSGGSLTCDAWNGTKGGILIYKCSGNSTINLGGSITVSAKGYRGGTNNDVQNGQSLQGESYTAVGGASTVANNGGGGGGLNSAGVNWDRGGGGGGYGTVGSVAGGAGNGAGGGIYGDTTLTRLYLGSGGGGGYGDMGRYGGGIIYIISNSITNAGYIYSKGGNGGSNLAGGAGSGGSIYLKSEISTLGTNLVIANGGTAGYGSVFGLGGVGGDGRIVVIGRVISGSTLPVHSLVGSLPSEKFNTNGTLTSQNIQISAAGQTSLDRINWIGSYPSNTKISFQTRTGVTNDSVYFNEWQTWTSSNTVDFDNVSNSSVGFLPNTGFNNRTVKNPITPQVRNIIYYESDDNVSPNCVQLSVEGAVSKNSVVTKTIPIKDLSTINWLSGWYKSPQTGNTIIFSMGENTAIDNYVTFNTVQANTWEKWYWYIGDISSTNKDAVNKLAIKYIGDAIGDIYIGSSLAQNFYESNDIMTSTPNDYIQFRGIFGTGDGLYSPELTSILLTYSPTLGSPESSLSSYYYTKWFDFKTPQLNKQFDSMALECNATTSNSVTIYCDYDIDAGVRTGTLSFPVTSTANTVRIFKNFPSSLYGKTMRLKLYNNDKDAQVTIKACEVRYRQEGTTPN